MSESTLRKSNISPIITQAEKSYDGVCDSIEHFERFIQTIIEQIGKVKPELVEKRGDDEPTAKEIRRRLPSDFHGTEATEVRSLIAQLEGVEGQLKDAEKLKITTKRLVDLAKGMYNGLHEGGGGSSQTRKKAKVVRTSNGDTFSIENPRKRWTGTEKYKKWVGKLTRKHKENKKEEDLCVGKGSICKGDLGIPRKLMPQFNTPEEVKRFVKFVRKAYGIRSNKTRRTARDLRPSQGEINRKRIKGLIADGVLDKVNVPLVVSGDNFVVDGHHRWAAFRLKKPDAKLPVMVVDAPIKDVLGIAVAWGAKHQEF